MTGRKKNTRFIESFDIAFAGEGPLLDSVWDVVRHRRFKKALPKVNILAVINRSGKIKTKNKSLRKAGVPVFSSCREMLAVYPNIGAILEMDEDSSYYAEMRRDAPLEANVLNYDAVNYIYESMQKDHLSIDTALRILRMHKSFSEMINNLDTDVLILDEKGNVVDANNAFLKRTGLSRRKIRGRLCKDLEGEDMCCNSDSGEECPLMIAIKSKKKYSNVYNRLHGNGLQYFKLDIAPLHDSQGKTIYLLIRDDITAAYQLQQRVQQSEKMAAIGELSTYIAHEIRNPLFAIGGFANALLRNTNLDPSGREKASIILEESQRLDGILKSILNFSKPVETTIGEMDLGQVAMQTVKVMSMGDENRKIETKLAVKNNLPHARGNADLVKQCLINLIKNAQEAMPDGGIITVSVRKVKEKLELSVQDTGDGISPQALEKVFNPFFSTKNKGAGLGLAMTKKLIEEMGGTLEITSELGKGTMVRVLLLPALALAEKDSDS